MELASSLLTPMSLNLIEDRDDEDNEEVASGDDGDDMVNFVNETIGAGRGQLRQVQYVSIFLCSPTILYSS